MISRLICFLLAVPLVIFSQAASGSAAPSDAPLTPPPMACAAGAPLGPVDLSVVSPHNTEPLPFQTINRLSEGDTVRYSPILRGKEKRPGEIALVLVPAKRDPKEDSLSVTDPKSAEKAEEWKIPQSVSLAAVVYGPQGLSKKKVAGFLSQDDLLIAQLADYAEKTAQTEALIEALSDSGSSAASVNAALTGFASQYGMSVQIDKTAPTSVQAQALFAAMNPQLAAYNPLSSSTAERVGQTASLATAAATLFFGSPIGLAAGGTAMLLDLRYIAFPGTQFRSSFAQPLNRPGTPQAGENTGLNLCGQRTPPPPHTRVAYIWAVRIPGAKPPDIRVGDANYIPPNQKTPVPVDVPDPQWKYLQRGRNWTLQNSEGKKLPVAVLKLGNQKALELDLTRSAVPQGDYKLNGFWDWTAFQAQGAIHVRPLSTFEQARIEAQSQNNLLAKAGKVPVTLGNSDFEFLDKVEIKKKNDEFAVAEPVRFLLPNGLRKGPQDRMDVQIDTANLEAGAYELFLSQQDGKSHAVPISILPDLPKIDNLPIVLNEGVSTQHYLLKGERLNLISQLESPGVDFALDAATPGQLERGVSVKVNADAKPGTRMAVEAKLTDRERTVTLPDALQITGPLPAIASSRLSLPANLAFTLQPNVFPSGYTLTAVLDVRNVTPKSALRLACSDDVGTPAVLKLGEQTANWSLQQLSADQLFVSFDTSSLPAGCRLQASIDNGAAGRSQPFSLARIIRLPKVDSLEADATPPVNGMRTYKLTGLNLEMIEKVGWDQSSGNAITSLPVPIAGQGQKQTLQIVLPEPGPATHSLLSVWLRGEKEPSATNVSAPNIAQPTASAVRQPPK